MTGSIKNPLHDLQRTLQRTRDTLFFIVGCGRSGTTLLQAMITAGGEVAIPMETKFYGAYVTGNMQKIGSPSDTDFGAFLDRVHADQHRKGVDVGHAPFLELADAAPRTWDGVFTALLTAFAIEAGVGRVGEKSPVHTHHVGELAQAFPEARFIHTLRDPRAVVLSRIRSGFTSRRLAPAIERWRRAVQMHKEFAEQLGERRYRVVRYEQLVRNPSVALQDACRFLGINFSQDMLDHSGRSRVTDAVSDHAHHQNLAKPVFTESIEKWRAELTAEQTRLIEGALRSEMRLMGYEPVQPAADDEWVRTNLKRSHHAAAAESIVTLARRATSKLARKQP